MYKKIKSENPQDPKLVEKIEELTEKQKEITKESEKLNSN